MPITIYDGLDFALETAGVDVQANRDGCWSPPGGAPDCAPGNAPGLPPKGVDLSHAPYVRLLYPPRVEKLPESQDIAADDYTIAVAPGATVTPATITFRLPTNQVGFLQEMAIYVLTPTAATRLRYAVFINGGAVPGFTNVSMPPGVAQFLWIPIGSMRVRIPAGGTVALSITNTGAGAEMAGGLIAGWFHPEAAEKAQWGSRV